MDLLSQDFRPWIIGATSFLLMLVCTPLVIRLANHMNWLAYPKADRWHKKPTALMGGIAIYCASSLSLVWLIFEEVPWSIWVGATLMFVTGLVDDLKNIKPAQKFALQTVAAGIVVMGGYELAPHWPVWISVPLTFLWIVGITNAVNLLDNMDGLAAGIAAIGSLVMAIFSILTGDLITASLSLAITGASLGFLIFNFYPAKIFMGDSGSLLLGYTVASLAMVSQSLVKVPGGFLSVLLVPAAVMAVPIFDTTLVTLVRTLSGRSIAQGGRDHSSHRLVFLGFSERKAVLTLYAVSLLFGSLGLLFHFAEFRLFYAVIIFLALGLIVFGIYIGSLDVYEERQEEDSGDEKKVEYVLLPVFMDKKLLAGMIGDLFLVAASFILAQYLRFEGAPPFWQVVLLSNGLPIMIGVKIPVFYFFGLYRGIWRHAGTPELIRIAGASLVGSLLAFIIIILVYQPLYYSQSFFVIDFIITIVSVSAIRFGFRLLPQYFASARQEGLSVLLYGAGDAGLLSLREIRQNPSLGYVPVGFIDDDPKKQRSIVQGVPVLGHFDTLLQVCEKHDIKEVLISSLRMPLKRKQEIFERCLKADIPCRRFQMDFIEMEEE